MHIYVFLCDIYTFLCDIYALFMRLYAFLCDIHVFDMYREWIPICVHAIGLMAQGRRRPLVALETPGCASRNGP